jgi:hypothetical protein
MVDKPTIRNSQPMEFVTQLMDLIRLLYKFGTLQTIDQVMLWKAISGAWKKLRSLVSKPGMFIR